MYMGDNSFGKKRTHFGGEGARIKTAVELKKCHQKKAAKLNVTFSPI
jgi:hypothetical protein